MEELKQSANEENEVLVERQLEAVEDDIKTWDQIRTVLEMYEFSREFRNPTLEMPVFQIFKSPPHECPVFQISSPPENPATTFLSVNHQTATRRKSVLSSEGDVSEDENSQNLLFLEKAGGTKNVKIVQTEKLLK